MTYRTTSIEYYCLLYRTQHISHLIYPLNTVLDDSIGCALWFAARGNGSLYSTGTAYESQCKVCIYYSREIKLH